LADHLDARSLAADGLALAYRDTADRCAERAT